MPGKNRPALSPERKRERQARYREAKRAACEGAHRCFYCGARFETERGQHIHEWTCSDWAVGL